jgi:outer membrane protein
MVFRTLAKALAPLTVSAGLFLASPAAHADQKIAVVDVQRVVLQTEDGLRAQATLKKLFESRQQELNKKQNELAKQKEDIEKQAKVMSKDALQKRMDDWQKQAMDLQQVYVEMSKELEKKQKELTDPVFEKVMGIVKRVAANEGFDMIVDRSAAPYFRSDLDLTDRCIQLYNGGGAPAPAQAPAANAGKK